jgi:3-hydroxyisobutyrate dehydrogenase-like beta-hydroxyacid dehydrogenase
MSDATIGYVGLGSMGSSMVGALLDHGVRTVVYDLDRSVADLARRCQIVSVCVPADAHVRAVLDGPEGLLANLMPGSTVAIHSTVLPETVQWAADAAIARGIGFVEAPVAGGDAAAAAGELTFLLVGEASAVEALEPLLDACGTRRIHLARLGDANRLKLCINLNSYACFMAAAEASRLTRDLGLDPADLHSAMEANGQVSPMLSRFLPIQTWDEAIIAKDLELMQRVMDDAGASVPLVQQVVERLPATYRLQGQEEI